MGRLLRFAADTAHPCWDVAVMLALVALVLVVGQCHEPAYAGDRRPARALEAWEGHGARCVVAYNPRGDMAAAGSAGLSCQWGHPYEGPFRRLGG